MGTLRSCYKIKQNILVAASKCLIQNEGWKQLLSELDMHNLLPSCSRCVSIQTLLVEWRFWCFFCGVSSFCGVPEKMFFLVCLNIIWLLWWNCEQLLIAALGKWHQHRGCSLPGVAVWLGMCWRTLLEAGLGSVWDKSKAGSKQCSFQWAAVEYIWTKPDVGSLTSLLLKPKWK